MLGEEHALCTDFWHSSRSEARQVILLSIALCASPELCPESQPQVGHHRPSLLIFACLSLDSSSTPRL
jgi:hypothetical protein